MGFAAEDDAAGALAMIAEAGGVGRLQATDVVDTTIAMPKIAKRLTPSTSTWPRRVGPT
jgi:hypothetical protein